MPWLNMRARSRYRGVNYIHPLKQRQVEDLLGAVKGYNNIERVIIFGSATENRCTPYSDVDVLFEGVPSVFIAPQNGEVYDILWERNLPPDAEIRKVIQQEGVVVYDAVSNE